MKLSEVYNQTGNRSDKGTCHSYIQVYDDLLEPYKNTKNNILEIGVYNGDSMKLWSDFFKHANIYGIDIDPRCLQYEDVNKRIFIDIGDSVVGHFPRINNLDVIIEDGSHDIQNQFATFYKFFPLLNEGGIYIIEDIRDFNDISKFKNIHPNVEIFDLRPIKGRTDDVLVVIRK